MRTTVDIDDDVLQAAKEIAASRKSTAGKVISEIFRKGLTRVQAEEFDYRSGFPQFDTGGKVITPEMVEDLFDQEDLEIIREAFPNR